MNAAEVLPKFAPRTQEGIFLSVFLQPGQVYSGDLLVASLDDFANNKQITVHRVKQGEVRWPTDGTFTFPLADAKQTKLNAKLIQALQDGDIEPETQEIEDEEAHTALEDIDAGTVDGGISALTDVHDEPDGPDSPEPAQSSARGSKDPAPPPKGPIGRPATKRPPNWTYEQWSNLSSKRRETETQYYRTIAGDRPWSELTQTEGRTRG